MRTERGGRSRAVLVALVLTLVGGLAVPVAHADDAARPGAATASAVPPADPPAAETVAGSLVVGLAPGASHAEATGIAHEVGAASVEAIDALDVAVLDVDEAAVDRVRDRLERHPHVAYVERDVRVEVADEVVPNDPRWPDQWSPQLTRAPEAWAVTTGSSDVTVAVLDTGVDPDHEDLDGALVDGRNLLEGSDDVTDVHGHGTGAAGVVAARTDNGLGVAGYCWTCSIMPVKVLGDDGVGAASTVAAGIVWATDNGADVVNLSLGASSGTATLEQAVRYATDRGVLVVASAGNAGEDSPAYPAAYPEVVGVAGSDRDDERYTWSNHGDDVELAAPGCNLSTLPGDDYGDFCGTSSAAPVVAGVAGLLLDADPAADAEAVREALTQTAVDVGGYVGAGRVDAYGAVTALASDDDEEEEADEEGDDDEALEGLRTERVAGDDRIATAVALAAHTHPDTAETVVLARGDTYPDALAGAPLARALDAPVLLTAPDRLSEVVAEEVARLGAERAVLLGSETALGDDVRADLEELGVGEVERHAGDDRFATAAAVAEALEAATDTVEHAYLVQGADPDPDRGWPDAVAVAGLAAMVGDPILLTDSEELSEGAAVSLVTLGLERITVVGGERAVAPEVVGLLEELGLEVERVAGDDRYATSRALAEAATDAGADPTEVWLATGRNFPDALAAGPAVAARQAVLLLVDGEDLDRSPATRDWLDERAEELETVRLVGGSGAISDDVESRLGTLRD